MIKYRVLQTNVDNPTLREGSVLMVYNKKGDAFRLTTATDGNLQISTMDGKIMVYPGCSNMIALKVDKDE